MLLPNLGAEEGARWRRSLRLAPVRQAAHLWALLFPRSAELLEISDPAPWSDALDSEAPAFEFMDLDAALVPWLSTDEAASLASDRKLRLAAAPPEVVARVHDKAFAQLEAERGGLVPEELAGQVRSFDPSELTDADVALREIERALEAWPAEHRSRFVLKPRLGSSGRGRVAGRDGRVDPAELRGALPRLAARGGLVLEPWLERSADLSVQLFVPAEGDIRVLGTLRQVVTRSGVCTGHRGSLAADGAVSSGGAHDAALRSAALRVADAARDAGFSGVCALDALVFVAVDGREILRPVVEFNARYTVGTIALGLVERARRSGLLGGADGFELALGGVAEHGEEGRSRLDLAAAALFY